MGLCKSCQGDHAKKIINSRGLNRVSQKTIYVNFDDIPELYEWIVTLAKEEERSHAQQIRYFLKKAMVAAQDRA